LGEDVTEELEYIPGRFIVNRIVRPRMACRSCETICQAPLPSRPIERGRPGPGLLAHVLVSKYADHLPLYRQSQIYEREGLDLDRSTLADWVGKSTALLEPLADAIGRHVLAGQAIFADDTPLKMQAKLKCKTARIWTYVRDERPWRIQEEAQAPPAAWYRFSLDRKGTHPADHLGSFEGWMHADGYAGFNELYRGGATRGRLHGPHPAQVRRSIPVRGLRDRRGSDPAHRPALRRREGRAGAVTRRAGSLAPTPRQADPR
jgi:transposase